MNKCKKIASVLDSKKAENIVALDVHEITLVADCFVIATGGNMRQVRALADYVEEELQKEDVSPLRVEGYNEGNWILMDYGDVIVHVFTEEYRNYYSLERLWGDAKKISYQE